MADREVAAFLSSNFRANDPHCCWLLDRQNRPSGSACRRVSCFSGSASGAYAEASSILLAKLS